MKSMSVNRPSQSKESGVVSIFIVIFFMIFTSVIIVGFIKMVNDDQSQSTDSDLSASALASAQSGAEDGKRVLLFCKSSTLTAAQQTACNAVLASTACDSVTSNSVLTSQLGIDVDTSDGRKDGIVSGNSDYQQRYTCMTIKTITNSVEGLSVEKGTSELIPLNAMGNYTSVQFSWHATADTRDGTLSVFRNNLLLPAENLWKSGTNAYAAAMRLEFIAYPKSGVNLNTLDADTRTVLLLPGVNGAPSVDATPNINTLDARDSDPNSAVEYNPLLAKCIGTREYACTMNVPLVGTPSPATHNYFLRVSSVYSSAYIKVELRVGVVPVQFNNVQPVIDVTGRANDVFRRIQTRVQYDGGMYLPQYAVEASEFCKNMTVTDVAATSSDICNP